MAKFSMRSIKGKLIVCFIVLIAPVIIIGSVAYNISLSVVTDMAEESVESMINRIGYENDRLMNNVQDFAVMISQDSVFQTPLREELPSDTKEVYKQRMDYNNKLYYQNQYNDAIQSVYVIGENGARFKSNMMTFQDTDFRREAWYQEILDSTDGIWFEPHAGSFAAVTVGEQVITFGVPIVDRFSGDRTGVVMVDVEVEKFQKNFDTQLVQKGEIFLLNEDNQNLVSSPGKTTLAANGQGDEILKNLDLTVQDEAHKINVGKEEYLVFCKASTVNGWKIVGIIPFNEILKSTSMIPTTIIIMIILSCGIALLFLLYVVSRIGQPIKNICNTMKKVYDGDMSVRAKVETKDEVGELATSFNNMIEQINVLMEIREENQKQLRKAELETLQAQINPHFLYNTLDSISWMARLKRIDEVEEMIEALTMFFRIGLSRGKEIITLEDELQHIHSYLRIQQVRYRNKLSYTIDIPQTLHKYLVVKMTLQPLVENAIYHGIKEKRGKGMISITGAEDKDMLILKVKDTGKGMLPEMVAKLNQSLQNGEEMDASEKFHSYGVQNVQRRIQIRFGKQYGLYYESTYMEGTTVTIKLPKEMDEK